MSVFAALVSKLNATQQSDGSYRAACPAHNGKSDNSLSLKQGDKYPVVIHCHSGCGWHEVDRAITAQTGIEIWARAQTDDKYLPKKHAVAEYEHDELPVKTVYRKRKDGRKQQWQSKGPTDGYHVLFWKDGKWTKDRPPEGTRVYLCEGEKAAAICSQRTKQWAASWCGGTGSAEKFSLERLKGLEVVYWADRDQAGQKCARIVSKRLAEAEITHWVIMEAGADGADIADLSHKQMWRRIKMVEGWHPVGETGDEEVPKKKVPKKRKPKEEEDTRIAHPPLKPLVAYTRPTERIDMLRHLMGQQGLHVRQNGRTHEIEVSVLGQEDWSNVEPGWLHYHLPKALAAVVQLNKDSQWVEGELPHSAAEAQLLALGYESATDGQTDDVCMWLKGLPDWDGTARCEMFLVEHYGVENTPYNRWLSAAIFIQVVVRNLNPGAKWRTVPVLSGPQFSGKSDLIRYLLPPHLMRYVQEELSLGARLKDQVDEMIGAAVVELAEMAGLNNQNMRSVKTFITKSADKTRLAYRRDAEYIKRQCAFIGTKNTEDELPYDKTGSTRWGVVECPKAVDVEKVMTSQLRNQLFAEALALADDPRWRGGFSYTHVAAQQKANLGHAEQDDELYSIVEKMAADQLQGLTLLEMAQEAGLMPTKDKDGDPIENWDYGATSQALRVNLGAEVSKFYDKKRVQKDGKREFRYMIKPSEPKAVPLDGDPIKERTPLSGTTVTTSSRADKMEGEKGRAEEDEREKDDSAVYVERAGGASGATSLEGEQENKPKTCLGGCGQPVAERSNVYCQAIVDTGDCQPAKEANK